MLQIKNKAEPTVLQTVIEQKASVIIIQLTADHSGLNEAMKNVIVSFYCKSLMCLNGTKPSL